ncbi:uncharacterized protein DFL_003782 [Arthrobotrys flagrans]|uniref:Response regulatory domain-containing protein n=1 Tax=Arthrobotrys flagrans TaxID=97331 RepID=A0A437A2W3_ARTFL|nr:hypothetical protein DFL_003782 [Arthrobotrys flagrans]
MNTTLSGTQELTAEQYLKHIISTLCATSTSIPEFESFLSKKTMSASLQGFLDSADTPTLVLDFRLPQYLDEPSKATISDAVVSQNAACKLEKFKNSVESLVEQRLGDGRLNPRFQARDPIIGAHTEKHVIGRDVWTCSGVGPYRIWTLQLEKLSEDSAAPRNHDTTETRQDDVSANSETIDELSREQQLFNKLDHIYGPLKAFCHLADQTLTDIQKAIKDFSNPSPSQDAISNLNPIESNLRTLSSGLSLLKDLSDISSFTPKPAEPPTPKEPPSDQALLSKILSRVHPPPPDLSTYRPMSGYTISPKLEAHIPTLRALVIEDNLINSKILRKFSHKLGVLHEYITPAYNGAEGLQAIEEMVKRGHFPDIIFVDFAMPVMGGLEFLEKFRERWPGRRTRIVGMFVHGSGGDERMERMGANSVISKPIRLRILQQEIEQAATLKMTREIEFRGRL